MKSINVTVGIATELAKELDNKISVMLTRLELACRNNQKEIWKRVKSTVMSLLLKGVVSSFTDNSIINTIADVAVAYNLFKDILLVKKILNEAEKFDEEKIKAELERLEKVEFDIEF
jgi:hypothetical protein|nr:MAG TPA: hypothetical protein [Caudoviricetes sp.]